MPGSNPSSANAIPNAMALVTIPIQDISNELKALEGPGMSFLFSPEQPISGENSSSDPSQLTGGEFQLLQNMRYSNREFRVRDGSFLLTAAAPFANAQFRGSWSGYLEGSLLMLVAYRDTVNNYTKVYSVTGLSGNVWTFVEITNGPGTPATDETAGEAGVNNGTRFTADGWVTFAEVSDSLGPAPSDMIIFCNGVNAPRSYGLHRGITGGPTTTVATVGAITTPDPTKCTSSPDVAGFVDLRTSGSTTAGASTGSVSQTKGTTSGDTYYQWSITGTGTATITLSGASAARYYDDTTASFLNSTTLRLNMGTQLLLVVNDDITDPIWNYSTITLNNAGSPVTVWDPTNAIFDPPFYYAISTNTYIVGFNLLTSQVGSILMSDFRINVTGIPLSATRVVNLHGIMHSGYVQSTRTHTVSYLDAASRSESGGVVCQARTGPKLGGIGGRGCTSVVTASFPRVTGLYAVMTIAYSSSPLSPRVDTAMLYGQDPGESDYYFVQFMSCPRSTSFTGSISYKFDNTTSASRNLTRPAPAFSTVSIPYGKYLLSTNGRLFVGGVNTSEVWISFDRMPFRFSQNAPVTGSNAPKNAAFHKIQGETIMGIIDYPGQTYGVATVAFFTNKKTYWVSGVDSFSLSRLNEVRNSIGTIAPRSISKRNGEVYCLGNDRQVWRYGYFAGTGYSYASADETAISRYVIDDRLKTADFTNAYGAATEYGYVLSGKSPGDSTQNTMFRYDGIRGAWGSDRFTVTGISGMMNFDSAIGDRRLLLFGDDGKIYWHEKAGEIQDAGSYIPVRITSREITTNMWSLMCSYHLGMIATLPATKPVFTITKTGQRTGTITTSTLDFTGAAGNRVYRKDVMADSAKSMPGVRDVSIVVDIQGNVSGGMRFKSIMLEVEKEDGDESDTAA